MEEESVAVEYDPRDKDKLPIVGNGVVKAQHVYFVVEHYV